MQRLVRDIGVLTHLQPKTILLQKYVVMQIHTTQVDLLFATIHSNKQQFSPRHSGFKEADTQMSVLQLSVQKARYLSPGPSKPSDKFDFACFIKFLIQLGIRCFPAVENQTQAVLILIEKFVLPLLSKNTDRSVQAATLQKLITLVN